MEQAGFDGVQVRSHMIRKEVLLACDATGLNISRVHIKEYSREIAGKQSKWNGFKVKLQEGTQLVFGTKASSAIRLGIIG